MSGAGNRKLQDDKKDKIHHAVAVLGEDRAHKSPKSVSFSSRIATAAAANTTGNCSIATTNSNRQRHHSHIHHQILPLPPQTNGNSHSRNLSYSSSDDSETEEDSPDLEYSSFSLEEAGEPIGESTHIMELPENVMEFVFTLLPLSDLVSASLVCYEWRRIVNDENNDVWRSHCLTQLPHDAQNFRLLQELPSYKSKLRAFYHAWNPSDCSRNIFVKTNGFTIHRNPVAQSTDGVRGKLGFHQGRHAWEVIWEGPLGTVAVIGVATGRAEMRAQGYVPLLGQDDQSWGWNLVENVLLHHGVQGNYPLINNAPRYQVGDKIRVILDCEDNTLSFEKDNEFYGVAFRGLPAKERLYPAISAVYGNTEVSMIYIGAPIDG